MQQLELEIEVAIRSGNSSSSFAQEPHVRHKEKPLHISLRRRHGSGGHVRVGGGPGGGGACNRPHGAGVRGRIARRQAARKGRHRLGPLALDVMRQGRPFVFWKLDDDVKVQDGRETKQDAGDLPDHVKAEAKRGEEHQEAETAPRRVHEAKVFRNGCCNLFKSRKKEGFTRIKKEKRSSACSRQRRVLLLRCMSSRRHTQKRHGKRVLQKQRRIRHIPSWRGSRSSKEGTQSSSRKRR
mmetsp:Transcript_33584/g.68649  ORF Transcript_33584/g.68649 Transcript_33584/m.68649 type:complete len:239 (-) Transcript_33584:184-900(-)